MILLQASKSVLLPLPTKLRSYIRPTSFSSHMKRILNPIGAWFIFNIRNGITERASRDIKDWIVSYFQYLGFKGKPGDAWSWYQEHMGYDGRGDTSFLLNGRVLLSPYRFFPLSVGRIELICAIFYRFVPTDVTWNGRGRRSNKGMESGVGWWCGVIMVMIPFSDRWLTLLLKN